MAQLAHETIEWLEVLTTSDKFLKVRAGRQCLQRYGVCWAVLAFQAATGNDCRCALPAAAGPTMRQPT